MLPHPHDLAPTLPVFLREALSSAPLRVSAANLPVKPSVPATAIWSRRDGLVPPRAACGLLHEADEQIEQDCSHMGFIASADAIRRIGDIIAR